MVDPNNSMFQSAQHFNINGGEYITGHYTKNVYMAPSDNASSDQTPPLPPSQSPSASFTGRDKLLQAFKNFSTETDSDFDDDESPWDMFGPIVGSWVTTALTKKPEPFIDAWSRCASKMTSRIAAQQRDTQQSKAESKAEPNRETENRLSQVQVLMAEYDELSSSLEAMQKGDGDSAQNLEESWKKMKRMKEILEILERKRTGNESI